MDIVVAYDVCTETKEGRRRLRRVAKVCESMGQRVQFSVFECTVNETEYERLKQRLRQEVHTEEDSLRLYRLQTPRAAVVEVIGRDGYQDFRDVLMV